MTRASAAVILLLLAAGCGVEVPSSGGLPSRNAPVTSTVPPPAPIEEWVSDVEPKTGATFLLPRATVPVDRAAAPDGSTAHVSAYQTRVAPGILLSVGFAGLSEVDYSAEGLESVFDQIVAMLEDGGATDLEVLRYEPGTVEGRPAVDYELTFTAKNGTTSHWFVRSIGDGISMISVQSIGSFEPSAYEEGHPVLAEYHQLVVENLKFP